MYRGEALWLAQQGVRYHLGYSLGVLERPREHRLPPEFECFWDTGGI